MSPRIKTAILNATSWLRANRDHHITGDLAETKEGDFCRPNDPNAVCFCVLGRISKELDQYSYPDGDEEFAQFLHETNQTIGMIYGMNDDVAGDDWTKRPQAVCGTNIGNEAVLDFLEEKVNANV